MNNLKAIVVLFAAAVCVGCSSIKPGNAGKNLFTGTIVYNVEVIGKDNHPLPGKNKRDLLGNEMAFTIFKNGDVQMKYAGTSIEGYDVQYISLEQSKVLEKYKSSDTTYIKNASILNFVKLNDLRVGKDTETAVLNYKCKNVAIAAQEIDGLSYERQFLNINYWYSEDIKIDKSKYGKINNNLWSYFMNKSDGSVYLKYELDYFTHKIVYTAKEIKPKNYIHVFDENNPPPIPIGTLK